MWKVSPSQIKTFAPEFGGCQRKWGYQKIDKIPDEGGQAAALGKAVHAQLERYFRDGIDFDEHAAGRIAMQGLPALPDREHVIAVEQPLTYEFDGVTYHGIADLVTEGEILDHKTSSNPEKYAITDLGNDPQALVYAMSKVVTEGWDPVALKWIYYHTRRKTFEPKVVERLLPSEVVRERFVRLVHPHGKAIVEARHTIKRAEDLPANPAACSAFGGCPYAAFCPKTQTETLVSLFGKGSSMGLKEKLQRKKAPPRPGLDPSKVKWDGINAPEAPTNIETLREASRAIEKVQGLSKKDKEAAELAIAEAAATGEPIPEIEPPEVTTATKDDIVKLVRSGRNFFTADKNAGTVKIPYAHGRSISALDSSEFSFKKLENGIYKVWLASEVEPDGVEVGPVELSPTWIEGTSVTLVPMDQKDRKDAFLSLLCATQDVPKARELFAAWEAL